MNPQTTFDFSQALIALKAGMSVSRLGWNGKGMFLQYQFPYVDSKMTRDYIYMTCPIGSTTQFGGVPNEQIERIPWLASQTDLMSSDWVTVSQTNE